ncbi:MAG: flagellar basal-body MS-ring/collar protein FliF [Hyphomicrobiales bacterium]|nr:flagellar basal-body MS-ring/collar protein FliF [Hyphomicrobiales bacterium]
MTGSEQIERLLKSLGELGAKRLAILSAMGVFIFAAVGLGSHYLSRPADETLYVGLSMQDIGRMSAALNEAGIGFDVSSDSTSISVRRGQSAKARMLLAEKGLPGSANSGYELFDKLGSMGLTSFMQDVTRVRALEGEIARTIQGMKGVKAARVHIVLPDAGSFRRNRQLPSASVVVRTETPGDFPSAQAIRHLVAAAIPSMTSEQVTVLSTDGVVLGSPANPFTGGPSAMLGMERTVANELEANIRRTLTPYLGMGNFEISVAARLNTDKRQINETAYDPESRVERSVRSVKETGSSQNNGRNWTASVEANLPAEQTASKQGEQSTKQSERKEDLTNYEVNSKIISTVSDGYRIEHLGVAVVVNRKRVAAVAGKDATPQAIDAQLKEVERLAASAAGVDAKRGDQVTVAAVDFMDDGRLDPIAGPGVASEMMAHLGSVVNAAALLGATFILVWFGMRPAMQILVARPAAPALAAPAADVSKALASPATGVETAPIANVPQINLASRGPQKQLEQVVEANDEQAAAVLKQWMRSR